MENNEVIEGNIFFDNIKQMLIENMADFLDKESIQIEEYLAGVSDPVCRAQSELHIRMADAAFKEYLKTIEPLT